MFIIGFSWALYYPFLVLTSSDWTFCFVRLLLDMVDVPVSLWLIDTWKYSNWLFVLVAVCYSSSGYVCFEQGQFCANEHAQLIHICYVIHGDMVTIYHSSVQLFSTSHLFSIALSTWKFLFQLEQCQILLHFSWLIITINATSCHWSFWGSGLPLSFFSIC